MQTQMGTETENGKAKIRGLSKYDRLVGADRAHNLPTPQNDKRRYFVEHLAVVRANLRLGDKIPMVIEYPGYSDARVSASVSGLYPYHCTVEFKAASGRTGRRSIQYVQFLLGEYPLPGLPREDFLSEISARV